MINEEFVLIAFDVAVFWAISVVFLFTVAFWRRRRN